MLSILKKWYRENVNSQMKNTKLGRFMDSLLELIIEENIISVRIASRRLVSLRDWSTNNACVRYVLEAEQEREVFVMDGKTEGGKCFQFFSPDVYYTVIKNVCVRGRSNGIFWEDKCIYPIERQQFEAKWEWMIYRSLFITDKKVCYAYSNSEKVVERAIMLLDQSSYNYYHLTIEILSRLTYIDSIGEYRDYPLLIDKCVWEIEQFKELVRKVNIYNHEIILIENIEMCKVKELVVISPCAWMPTNVKKGYGYDKKDYMVSVVAMSNLRRRLVKNETNATRKIFVARMNTENARLINEEEIRDIFQTFGFEVIYPEHMTLEEQIKVFAEAAYVAGATGAAFTNILYCKEGTQIICIVPNCIEFYGYSTMAYLLKQKVNFIDAEVIDNCDIKSLNTYLLDEEVCKSRLMNILN